MLTRPVKMRVHEALWKFAEIRGNDYARTYAIKRKQTNEKERAKGDSKWLRGHGDKRLRTLWLSLPIEDRQALMSKTPDPSFPMETTGVFDERFRKARRVEVNARQSEQAGGVHRGLVASSSTGTGEVHAHQDRADSQSTSAVFQKKVAVMKSARAAYHRIVSREHMIKLQTAYDRGNMAGVIESIVYSVVHAIHLARAQDSPTSAVEAFEAVCERVADVFGPALCISRFDPELPSDSDTPSPEFAAKILSKALGPYQRSVTLVHEECRAQGVKIDPDRAILKATHSLFGKAEGIPPL
jgi:hypothetical protein